MCIRDSVQGKTAAVTQDARIQQVFIGDGGYLEKISIYAIQNLSRRVVSLTVSDELGETVSVSYTHLDVYKRQPLCSVGRCLYLWIFVRTP